MPIGGTTKQKKVAIHTSWGVLHYCLGGFVIHLLSLW
jgi:hypothetical protein